MLCFPVAERAGTAPCAAQAAAEEPFGVTLGAVLGHAFCTGLAVIGGKLLASSISERKVLTLGGLLFVVFSIVAFVQGPGE